jgi:uncharacterized protein (TIGR02453 family)
LRFLRALERNNRREWFEANKREFLDHVRTPMEGFVAALSAELTRFAPEYATEPQRAIYRIYRDTRFSADKTPYKTHTSALFWRKDLPRNESSAFYVEISPRGVGVGGGIYMTPPDHLQAIRGYLAENYREFRKLTGSRAIRAALGELQGEKLVRPPKGFTPDHPAIDLIRAKQWYYFVELDPALAETPQVFIAVSDRFRKMFPVVDFLNVPLLGLAKNRRGASLG